MNAIFLPLRSNAAWFTSAETHSALARRLKSYLLIHDEIVVQDGRYEAVVGDTFSRAVLWDPSNGNLGDRREISYFQPGESTEIVIDDMPVAASTTQARYEVDFVPLLAEAGLLDVPYVKRIAGDAPSEWREIAERTARAEVRSATAHGGALRAALPEHDFLAKKTLEGLYIDSAMAAALDLPLAVDAHVGAAVGAKNAAGAATAQAGPWMPAGSGAFHDAWVRFALPDLGEASWDEVIHARESAAGADYRAMIARVAAAAEAVIAGGGPAAEAQAAADRAFVAELVSEVLQRRATVAGAVMNMAAGLAAHPILSALALMGTAAAEGGKVIGEYRSWIKFLTGLPRVL